MWPVAYLPGVVLPEVGLVEVDRGLPARTGGGVRADSHVVQSPVVVKVGERS